MNDNMSKAFNYACEKYYSVIYKREHYGNEQRVDGLLLNYASGNIVLLSDKGMYHIKYNDVIFMKPIEPRMDKFSEEFKELLKSFNKDDKPATEVAVHDWFATYFKGAKDFMEYLLSYTSSGKPLYKSEMEDILVEFAKQYGEVKEINK